MGYYKDLMAYQKGYALAMKIFLITKKFPGDEKFSLVDQIRRSSRSVCTNLAEASMRKKYSDYFLSKLNDASTENSETEVWLRFAKDCGYLTDDEFSELNHLNAEIGKLLWYMMENPKKFT